MSTTMKDQKEKQDRSAGAQKEVSGTVKQRQNDEQKAISKKRDPLIVPEIPGTMKKLLNDKDRPVKELKAINVKFYPNNIHEVEYLVVLEDEHGNPKESTLSVTQFMKLMEQKVQYRKVEHEKQTFDGLASKWYKRLYIVLPDNIDVAEGRRITAIKAPPVVKKLLGLSQKDFAEQFPTPEQVVSFWEKSPETATKAMNDYQKAILDKVNWSDTLVAARREVTEQKMQKAARELEKSKRKALLVESETDPKGAAAEAANLGTQSRNTRFFASAPKGDGGGTKTAWADFEDAGTEKRFSDILELVQGIKDPLIRGKVPLSVLADPLLLKEQDHFEWFKDQLNLLKTGHEPTWLFEEPLSEEQKALLEHT